MPKKETIMGKEATRIQPFPPAVGLQSQKEALQIVRRAQSTGDAFDLASLIDTEAGITSIPSLVLFLPSFTIQTCYFCG